MIIKKNVFLLKYIHQIVELAILAILDHGEVILLRSLDSVYHSVLRFISGESYNTHHCILYDKIG